MLKCAPEQLRFGTNSELKGGEAVRKSLIELGVRQFENQRNFADLTNEELPPGDQRGAPGQPEPGVPPVPPPGDQPEPDRAQPEPESVVRPPGSPPPSKMFAADAEKSRAAHNLDRALHEVRRSRWCYEAELDVIRLYIGEDFTIDGAKLTYHPRPWITPRPQLPAEKGAWRKARLLHRDGRFEEFEWENWAELDEYGGEQKDMKQWYRELPEGVQSMITIFGTPRCATTDQVAPSDEEERTEKRPRESDDPEDEPAASMPRLLIVPQRGPAEPRGLPDAGLGGEQEPGHHDVPERPGAIDGPNPVEVPVGNEADDDLIMKAVVEQTVTESLLPQKRSASKSTPGGSAPKKTPLVETYLSEDLNGKPVFLTEEIEEHLRGEAEPVPVLGNSIKGFKKKKSKAGVHEKHMTQEEKQMFHKAKLTEWETIYDDMKAVQLVNPTEAKAIRQTRGDRVIKSRYVLTKKEEDGHPWRPKARLTMCGYMDPDAVSMAKEGKLASPTVSNRCVQMIASHEWDLELGDIRGAFLEADRLDDREELFAELPPGGIPGVEEGCLMRIISPVYGLVDAPARWYKTFSREAENAGFIRSRWDKCFWYIRESNGKLGGVMVAHVDDTLTGGGTARYRKAIAQLRARFPYRKWRKHNGDFTGSRYIQDPHTKEVTVDQEHFVAKMSPMKPVLGKDEEPLETRRIPEMRKVCGDGIWLSSNTRPDIAVQVSMAQSAFPNPTKQQARVASQMVRRAKQLSDYRLRYRKIDLSRIGVLVYTDAAYQNREEKKSQGGYLIGFSDHGVNESQQVPFSPCTWRSWKMKQPVTGTLGAELQAMKFAWGAWRIRRMLSCRFVRACF